MHLRHDAWEKNDSVAQICILSGAGLQSQSLLVTHTMMMDCAHSLKELHEQH